jgi:hypothetical protein
VWSGGIDEREMGGDRWLSISTFTAVALRGQPLGGLPSLLQNDENVPPFALGPVVVSDIRAVPGFSREMRAWTRSR